MELSKLTGSLYPIKPVKTEPLMFYVHKYSSSGENDTFTACSEIENTDLISDRVSSYLGRLPTVLNNLIVQRCLC